jgi:hypothetical protein
MYEIETACAQGLGEWQNYVDNHPLASGMHHAGWYQVLRHSFDVKLEFLFARNDNGAISGVLPMYFSRSIFADRHLTTLDDGLLVDDTEAAAALVDAALGRRDLLDARYLLIRAAVGGTVDLRPTAIRPIVRRIVPTGIGGPELLGRLSHYMRRDIRRAVNRGYSIRRDADLACLDTVFYDEYASHMRHLGTPVFARRMMSAIKKYLGPDRLRLYLAMRGEEVVGGVLCLVARSGWLGLYAVVREALLRDYVNYLLFWHAILEAAEAGVAHFDLGRNTPGGGVHEFKNKWPGEERRSEHRYFARPGTKLPNLAVLHQGRSFRQRLWMKLPLGITNRFGPLLRQQLPFG